MDSVALKRRHSAMELEVDQYKELFQLIRERSDLEAQEIY
jgi:hypothetical protein